MKNFHFSLQKVLERRRTELELSEAECKRRSAALAAVEAARQELAAAASTAELDVRRLSSIEGGDLAALAAYREQVKKQDRKLLLRRAEEQKKVDHAQHALLEARRKCRLLERLGDRRLAEWKAERDRELEEAAAESYLARWVRGQA